MHGQGNRGMLISNEVNQSSTMLFPAKLWYIKHLIYIDKLSFEDEGKLNKS